MFADRITPSNSKNNMTISEFKTYLEELIACGYGDYKLYADTQDGSSYSVRGDLLILKMSKTATIY